MGGTRDRDVLVVGVDGSASADAALRHAFEEATARGASVRAVRVVPIAEMVTGDGYVLVDPEMGRAAAATQVDRQVQGIRERTGLDVDVEAVATIGSPIAELVDAARDAALLVVGHRGRGPWRSALLGSVALGVVLQTPCPVTVVPAPVPAPETARAERVQPEAPLPIGPIA